MKWRKPANKNESGYTLVELMVTLLIAGSFIGSASLIMNNQSYLTQKAKGVAVANSYAENKIESLRSKGYLGLTDGTTDISSELPTELASPKSASQEISTLETGVKVVTVSLQYNEQGTTRSYSYKTYIGELGVGQY